MALFSKRAAAACAAALLFSTAAAELRIEWSPEAVELLGLDSATRQALSTLNAKTSAEWQRVFSVHTELETLLIDPSAPPVAGAYELGPDWLRFKPAFPLEPGVKYRAAFRPHRLSGAAGQVLASSYQLPKPKPQQTTRVAAIYPTAAAIPENVLKFYIHFSAPMSGGRIYDHIFLREASGAAVELPFLEIDEELWNPEMTRLTLFLDPGRIKRGVKPLEDIGPSLRPGREYELEIAASWLDAKGAPLAERHVKRFKVTPADRQTPEPSRWKIEPPLPGTTNALVLLFDEPLDHGIATRTIQALNHSKTALSGAAELARQEREWRFTPASPWKAGSYSVQIPSLIEDLAGNNIGEAFDVDTGEGRRRRINRLIELPFEIQ